MNNLIETYPLVILEKCSDKYKRFFTYYDTYYKNTICILDKNALEAEVTIRIGPPCTGLLSHYTDDHELSYCVDLPFRHRAYYGIPYGDVLVVGDLWAFKEDGK